MEILNNCLRLLWRSKKSCSKLAQHNGNIISNVLVSNYNVYYFRLQIKPYYIDCSLYFQLWSPLVIPPTCHQADESDRCSPAGDSCTCGPGLMSPTMLRITRARTSGLAPSCHPPPARTQDTLTSRRPC